MITGSILLIFIGSFFSYNTSKKAILDNSFFFEKWIQCNVNISKTIAVLCFIVSYTMIVTCFGQISGSLFWLFSLVLEVSLLVVIAPLRKLSYNHISLFFLILFILEFI